MRAFIAVELSGEIRAELAALQRILRAAKADVRWVEQNNLHLTMRFLGDITDEQRAGVEDLVRAVADRHAPIRMRLSALGAFPSTSAPRVVWIGLDEGAAELAEVAQDLEAGLAPLKIPTEDRPFVAHITLGRARSPKHQPQLGRCLQQTVWEPPGPFTAGHLTLFQSVLSGPGPVYTPLLQALFAGRERRATPAANELV